MHLQYFYSSLSEIKVVSWTSLIMTNIAAFLEACYRFLWDWFAVALLNQHWAHVVYSDLIESACSFLELCIITEATTCTVICLTCSNFPNVLITFYVILYWRVKKVLPINYDATVFYLHLWKKISRDPLLTPLSSNDKTNSLLALSKLRSMK